MLFLVVLKMLDPFAGHSTMALNQGFTIRKDYGDAAIFGWGWYKSQKKYHSTLHFTPYVTLILMHFTLILIHSLSF